MQQMIRMFCATKNCRCRSEEFESTMWSDDIFIHALEIVFHTNRIIQQNLIVDL